MDKRLTPAELSNLKGNKWIKGRWHYLPYEVMDAQITKLQSYYASMAPEELRHEVRKILRVVNSIRGFGMGRAYNDYVAQILSLVIAWKEAQHGQD